MSIVICVRSTVFGFLKCFKPLKQHQAAARLCLSPAKTGVNVNLSEVHLLGNVGEQLERVSGQ